jgi:alkanesulfonate monooxygenase SsuD/methylene tetrahydromethanopterin reductase-like flavin-dependent oxidoreductase (luciferase family)
VPADSDDRVWFGLFLPQLRMSFETILERTLAAEAAGFDSVWLMDHLAARRAEWDTLEVGRSPPGSPPARAGSGSVTS